MKTWFAVALTLSALVGFAGAAEPAGRAHQSAAAFRIVSDQPSTPAVAERVAGSTLVVVGDKTTPRAAEAVLWTKRSTGSATVRSTAGALTKVAAEPVAADVEIRTVAGQADDSILEAATPPSPITARAEEPVIAPAPVAPAPMAMGSPVDPYVCKSLFGPGNQIDDLGLLQLSVDTRAMTGTLSEDGAPTLATDEDIPTSEAAKRIGVYANATPVGDGCLRFDCGNGFYWAAPSFYHRPLYFEQAGVERYGHYVHGDCVQSAVSTAHFFGDFLILPYKLGASPYQCLDYTLGRYRPGNCNPKQPRLDPISRRGLFFQAVTVTGLVFLAP